MSKKKIPDLSWHLCARPQCQIHFQRKTIRRIYCSKSCISKEQWRKDKVKYKPLIPKIVCNYGPCLVKFRPNPHQKYHSPECLSRHRLESQRQKRKSRSLHIPISCRAPECEEVFIPRDPRQHYHSVDCQRVENLRRLSQARKDARERQGRPAYGSLKELKKESTWRNPRVCADSSCNVTFTPTHYLQRYHSPTCRYRTDQSRALVVRRRQSVERENDSYRGNTHRYMRYNGDTKKMEEITTPTTLLDGPHSTDDVSWEEALDLMFPYTDAELKETRRFA